jgi:hypothetical protein
LESFSPEEAPDRDPVPPADIPEVLKELPLFVLTEVPEKRQKETPIPG